MKSTMEQAQAAVTEARTNVERWETAVDDALQKQEQLATRAPSTPDEIEAFADDAARAQGRVTAARAGLKAAELEVVNSLERVVRADLADTEEQTRKAEQEYAAHRRKVDKILAQLSEVDGAEYRPIVIEDVQVRPGEPVSVKASRAAELKGAIYGHQRRAEILNTALAGTRPFDSGVHTGGHIPAHVYEYLEARQSAGIPTAAEAERAAAIAAERAPEQPSQRFQARRWGKGPRSTGTLPSLAR